MRLFKVLPTLSLTLSQGRTVQSGGWAPAQGDMGTIQGLPPASAQLYSISSGEHGDLVVLGAAAGDPLQLPYLAALAERNRRIAANVTAGLSASLYRVTGALRGLGSFPLEMAHTRRRGEAAFERNLICCSCCVKKGAWLLCS